MQLHFRGYLKPAHTLRFNEQAVRRSGVKPLSLLTVAIVSLAIGIASIFLPLVGTICWLLASVMLTQSWYHNRKQKKAILNESSHQKSLTEGTITEEGFIFVSIPKQVKWSELTAYSSDEEQVAVFQGEHFGYIFPRDFFANEQDWQQFLYLLQSRLMQNVASPSRNLEPAEKGKKILTELENRLRKFDQLKGGERN